MEGVRERERELIREIMIREWSESQSLLIPSFNDIFALLNRAGERFYNEKSTLLPVYESVWINLYKRTYKST